MLKEREEKDLDERSPLGFIALSIIFALAGFFLMWVLLFLALISFFIAFVWFIAGYAQYRRLKEEESRGRRRF